MICGLELILAVTLCAWWRERRRQHGILTELEEEAVAGEGPTSR